MTILTTDIRDPHAHFRDVVRAYTGPDATPIMLEPTGWGPH